MNIEVEIRAKVNNFTGIKKVLKGLNAEFVKSEKQADRIFGSPRFLDSSNMIIEGGLSARIREVDNIKSLEFKEISRKKGSGIELSCEVASVNLAKKMLKKLDFNEAFVVKKNRETYTYDDFTICLDNVAQLGNFIEIEKITSLNSEKAKEIIKNECLNLLQKLDSLAIIEPRKYGDLIQEKINKRKK